MGLIVSFACALTPIFNLLTSQVSLGSAIQGFVDALLVSTVLTAYVFFVRDGLLRAWFRRRSFVVNLLANGTVLFTLFLLARALGQLVTSGNPTRFYTSFSDAHLRYAIPFVATIAFGLQFLLQMNRMIGTNGLRYFLTGVYSRPKAEERIFMFLDLASSTQLAERLGGARYYELLRRFVDDLGDPILESRGAIYQYAGDEVIVTWDKTSGLQRANCVRCYFGIKDAVARNATGYQRDFGTIPTFRAGLHGGEVIAGELGDIRQEIIFTGDTLNTAARLEEYARQHRRGFIISGELLAQIELPDGVRAERLEEFRARGKEQTTIVYALTRDGEAESVA